MRSFGQRPDFIKAISSWRVVRTYAMSSAFVTGNWMICIWAINAGYIVETSLGSFINPLIYVVFGLWVFKEKLNKWQWVAIALAAIGLVITAIGYGKFPWIALAVAMTFALYGLVKKQAPLSSFYGLTLETTLLTPFALAYLIVVEAYNLNPAFGHVSTTSNLLIVGGGLITIVPLFFFSAGAKEPSILVGVCIYHEPLSEMKLGGFVCVWVGLVVYTVEGFVHEKAEAAEFDEGSIESPEVDSSNSFHKA
ncbi:membrane protein [Thraustotheca clavata]|uniref:Membrane protein n=1 Tax=Thraustotheca clavata TaxID=74557 RepID=A0A1W0ACB7_9STRA|nr:membrane protein [Thraustotheca clavata]